MEKAEFEGFCTQGVQVASRPEILQAGGWNEIRNVLSNKKKFFMAVKIQLRATVGVNTVYC